MTKPRDRLQLYLMDKENLSGRIINDTFLSGDDGWTAAEGDFHQVTIDTNADTSSGLDGGILLNSFGSYYGGTCEKTFEVSSYGELIFEWYLQNDDPDNQDNVLIFYLDGKERLRLARATPWERTRPIGLAPGTHTARFEYDAGAAPDGKKGVFNSFEVWQAVNIPCYVAEYKPPIQDSALNETKTIRGYTRIQQASESDTKIAFQAIFYAEEFIIFRKNARKIFYFADEYGAVYRGIFREIAPEFTAMASVYSLNLEMICDSRAGEGFC